MHRADPGAGQHRDRSLGDHGQVDRHPVAPFHAQRLEGVGAAIHLPVQLPVGQYSPVSGLALPDDRCLVTPWARQVAVQTVAGHIELPAHEPLRVGWRPLEHRLPGFDPFQRAGLVFPEPQAIALGCSVDFALRCRGLGELRRWRETPGF
jgi:hypothetical protein